MNILIRIHGISIFKSGINFLAEFDTTTTAVFANGKKIKQSHYRPGQAQRGFQKVKVHTFRHNGTGWW